MADHPLEPATDRCLGRLLPYQLANQTQTHLSARAEAPFNFYSNEQEYYSVLAPLSRGYSNLKGRLSTRYSPVRQFTILPKQKFSLDLHV